MIWAVGVDAENAEARMFSVYPSSLFSHPFPMLPIAFRKYLEKWCKCRFVLIHVNSADPHLEYRSQIHISELLLVFLLGEE